jgi:hypothetical protein
MHAWHSRELTADLAAKRHERRHEIDHHACTHAAMPVQSLSLKQRQISTTRDSSSTPSISHLSLHPPIRYSDLCLPWEYLLHCTDTTHASMAVVVILLCVCVVPEAMLERCTSTVAVPFERGEHCNWLGTRSVSARVHTVVYYSGHASPCPFLLPGWWSLQRSLLSLLGASRLMMPFCVGHGFDRDYPH